MLCPFEKARALLPQRTQPQGRSNRHDAQYDTEQLNITHSRVFNDWDQRRIGTDQVLRIERANSQIFTCDLTDMGA
eukprot:CAMPEP_0174245300 /NCGR_PEP_ID=MMETSP0417-20130205/38298_1 /TAXON_ID=242541 /ORGANISM="Mayorella sp, Strain BSH-02190019" /LENGTH=75 /DNA_ID=CAMNT_0015325065 /DNA_START=214 /DNA_END=438 /DNA_ORIENTATION=-